MRETVSSLSTITFIPGLSPAVAHVLVHPRHPFSFRHTLFTFGRCVSQPVICSTPPTRPLLFTTDEPDSAYEQRQQQPTHKLR